jgi:hypothetical protein
MADRHPLQGCSEIRGERAHVEQPVVRAACSAAAFSRLAAVFPLK